MFYKTLGTIEINSPMSPPFQIIIILMKRNKNWLYSRNSENLNYIINNRSPNISKGFNNIFTISRRIILSAIDQYLAVSKYLISENKSFIKNDHSYGH